MWCHGALRKPCAGRVIAGGALGLLVVASLLVPGALDSGEDTGDRAYAYRGYTEVMAYFRNLKRKYPELVETWIAQEEFPEMLRSREVWGHCGGEPCKTLIVRIGNKTSLQDRDEMLKRPEVFFSGALHGNERLGPLVVTELAGFLCSQYRRGNEEVRRLVDTRNTWIMPMTNAYGFAHNVREENGMDPNRDFPYLQGPDQCMRTQTGRAVNELFRRHLFQFMITFHGGMRALTYEWGSFNHMQHGKSTESPDDFAFTAIGKEIRAASGRERASTTWWYPFGRINDKVYPVNGGMEDWSYGAGFEQSPKPITVCMPKTYGGYDASRTQYRSDSIGSLVYLAEMDDAKTPNEVTLGHPSQIWSTSNSQGHVARNLRMCLKLIELAKPEVVVRPPMWPSTVQAGANLALEAHGFGCLTLSSARLLLIRRDKMGSCRTLGSRTDLLAAAVEVAALRAPVPCRGLTIWEPPSRKAGAVSLRGPVPSGLSGEFCAVLAAEFDSDWARQSHPDPALKPRAHAVRLRIDDHYIAQANDGLREAGGQQMRLDEHRVKLFPVRAQALVVQAGPMPAAPMPTAPMPATPTLATPTLAAPTPAAPTLAAPELAANASRSAFLSPASSSGGPALNGTGAGAGKGRLQQPPSTSTVPPAAADHSGLPSSFGALRVLAVLLGLAVGIGACHISVVGRSTRSICRNLPKLFGKAVTSQEVSGQSAEGAVE